MVPVFYVVDNGCKRQLLRNCYQANLSFYIKMALDFVAGCIGGKIFNIKKHYTGVKL